MTGAAVLSSLRILFLLSLSEPGAHPTRLLQPAGSLACDNFHGDAVAPGQLGKNLTKPDDFPLTSASRASGVLRSVRPRAFQALAQASIQAFDDRQITN